MTEKSVVIITVWHGVSEVLRGDEVVIIDLDLVNGGICPYCQSDLNNKYCQSCDVKWTCNDNDILKNVDKIEGVTSE